MDDVRLLLVADTHVPKRARDLPAHLWRAVESADVVVHAGDWVHAPLLDQLEERASHLVETGPAKGREQRCEELYGDADLLVFGHSHIPWDATTKSGLRLLNPGSPTDRRRQPFCTYMTLTVSRGRIRDLELHRLPPRAPRAPR